MNINLHIERLILDGLSVSRHQGPIIKSAAEAELSRLLREGGLGREWSRGGAYSSVPHSSIALVAESNPSEIGRQIAASVYGRIGRSR